MFFGAGNLIFPVQLGQMAGSHWLTAALGFLLTGTMVPFLAILAIAVTHSRGVYDIAKPAAPWFGTLFSCNASLDDWAFFRNPKNSSNCFLDGSIAIFACKISNNRYVGFLGNFLCPCILSKYQIIQCRRLDC